MGGFVNFFKTFKTEIAIGSAAYFAIGFLIGFMETIGYRTDREFKNGSYVDISKSGCVYKSYAAFLNPGHVVACELFRRRFEKEGL